MTVKTEVMLHQQEYRRDAYKLLSECYHIPDERLIETLSSLNTSRGTLYSELAKHTPQISDIASLVIDYSKLFVGPFSLLAPPYGSVYLEHSGQVMGNSTVDVRDRYAEEGLDIGLKEAPDHIAIELEFMYFLIFKAIEAVRNNNPKDAVFYQNKQRAFLETNLGIWVPDFTAKLKESAQTEFYRNLAQSTKSFINNDVNLLLDNSVFTSLTDQLSLTTRT
jgi:TorA maturation chaperone TorD